MGTDGATIGADGAAVGAEGATVGVAVATGAIVGATVAEGATVNGGRVGGIGATDVAHVAGRMIVSEINVTLPVFASSLPCTVVLAPTVIDVDARTVPLNAAVLPMSAAYTFQNTLQG